VAAGRGRGKYAPWRQQRGIESGCGIFYDTKIM